VISNSIKMDDLGDFITFDAFFGGGGSSGGSRGGGDKSKKDNKGNPKNGGW